MIPCTGVILSGGLNSRFSGNNKAFFNIHNKRIIDYIYETFKSEFQDIILVTNDPISYFDLDLKIVTDLFPVRSALNGIYAGLFYIKTDYAFFTACDTPFLKKDMIKTIISEIKVGIDIIIPETSNGREPLCAVYSKRCLKPIKEQLEKNIFKVESFFNKVRVKKIPENILREHDPDLISFYNINNPEILEKVKTWHLLT
ncbi:MAG: molybdenum cofactor guanylyltransferase [Desulfobacterales bacterium]|nr:molybdenum cofactor guanylyltransferase [Desulfobacterales bacterium]